MTVEPIPDAARLVHIGMPKTGTTTIQFAAHRARSILEKHRVLYPGTGASHRWAASSLLGIRLAPTAERGDAIPDESGWRRLVTEVSRHRRGRVLVSDELFSRAQPDQVRRLVTELGPEVHVVVSYRAFSSMIPSIWQQGLKDGQARTFSDWLDAYLAEPRDPSISAHSYARRHLAAAIAPWAEAVGPERTHLIVADSADPGLLSRAFEGLLALPSGTLDAPAETGGANRGLTSVEARAMVAVNAALAGHDLSDGIRRDLVYRGAIAQLQRSRQPGPEEPRLSLPSWAAARAQELGRDEGEAIRASGIHVIGDLGVLAHPPRRIAEEDEDAGDDVPMEVAVEILAGIARSAAQLHRSVVARRHSREAAERTSAPPPAPMGRRGLRERLRALMGRR